MVQKVFRVLYIFKNLSVSCV